MSPLPSSLSQEYSRHIQHRHRSVETRIAAVRALQSSTYSEVCNIFKVNKRTLSRWKRQLQETHDLSKKLRDRSMRCKLNEEDTQKLVDFINTNPGSTNAQAAAHLTTKSNQGLFLFTSKKLDSLERNSLMSRKHTHRRNQSNLFGRTVISSELLTPAAEFTWMRVLCTTMRLLDLVEA